MTANVMRMYEETRSLPRQDRLLLARMLLDSLLQRKDAARASDKDWQAMSLSHFQEGLDNTDDAVYDNWREHYHVPVR
jgi:hypothetical protein